MNRRRDPIFYSGVCPRFRGRGIQRVFASFGARRLSCSSRCFLRLRPCVRYVGQSADCCQQLIVE